MLDYIFRRNNLVFHFFGINWVDLDDAYVLNVINIKKMLFSSAPAPILSAFV